MSLVSSIYYGTSLLEKMGVDVKGMREKFKDMVQDFATDVVSKVPEDKINEKLANVEIDANLTAEEQVEREQKVETFKEIVIAAGGEENKFENIASAIESEPEKWGQVMKDVPQETLDNMQTSMENGEEINTMDVVKLAYGATSGAVTDFVDKYGDKPSEEAETSAENTNENDGAETKSSGTYAMKQEDRVAQAEGIIEKSDSSDMQLGIE